VLVNKRDFQHKDTINNLVSTLAALHAMRVIPIINENDVSGVATFLALFSFWWGVPVESVTSCCCVSCCV
jgi:hypothetical protein